MRRSLSVVLLSVLAGAFTAHGQPASPSLRDGPNLNTPNDIGKNEQEKPGVLVQDIVFKGARSIPETALDAAVAPFINTKIDKDDLKKIANALTKTYFDEGYFLSQATIKPQEIVNGVLIVDMVEGALSTVRINGADDHALTRYFESALNEKPAQRRTFERALTLIKGLPGYRVEKRSLQKDPSALGQFVFDLTISLKQAMAQLDATNKGVRAGTAWRGLVSGELRSVYRAGDRLQIGALSKPGALSELTYGFGRYQTPVGGRGLVAFVEGVASNSNPRSALVGRDLNGSLRSFGLGVNYPVVQTRRSQLSVSSRFDWVNSTEFEDGDRLYADRMRIGRLSAQYARPAGRNGRALFFLQTSQGLNVFNASVREGVSTSRPDADGQFLKFDGRAVVQKFVTDRISVSGSVIGQFATGPLLFLEEFAFGGGLYGRGYDFGEIIGDNGVAGFGEVGYHGGAIGLVDRWEVYSFGDIGAVWNKGQGLSIDGDPLYSAGAGVRVTLADYVFLNYEAAYPIADAPFTEKDDHARHRLQVTLTYQ
ncbi:MAG: POTRA domain-containing protein [Pseudomonadota bacterium]